MTFTRAEQERAKLEAERRAAAQKAKDERAAREALLEQRQQERCHSMHHLASALRANSSAAVLAQKTQLQRQRRGATDDVKQANDALRRQRNEQRAHWRAHGRQLNDQCVQTRNAASHARDQLRERNLSDAHRSTAELLDRFRQGAEAQTAFNDAKRMMANRVRKQAGLSVVRGARDQATIEKMEAAAALRFRAEQDALDAETSRQRHLETHRASAYRIELEASPERVRQLKVIEAERRASLTGGLRRQNRAREALALERRTEETASRQRMHDAVMCSRYGVPGGDFNDIHLSSASWSA